MAAIVSLIIRIQIIFIGLQDKFATKTGFFKKIYKFIDKIIFTLSDRVLVDSFSQKKIFN